MTRHEQMRRDAAVFHAEYPQVWHMFQKFTLDLIRAGHKHGGAKAVWERIRWETMVGYRTEIGWSDFKLNNNYTAFYARRFMRLHPEHAGFFETRKQKSKEAA